MAWPNGGPSRTSSPQWRRTRTTILERDNHTCTCGQPATQVDHINPHTQGGTDNPDNLRAICTTCHKRKTAAEATAARWPPTMRLRRPTEPHPGIIT